MDREIKRQQLISSIQKFAEDNDYTPADMHRLVNSRGGDVSATTMRRILKGEAVSIDTLRRVASALFDVNAAPLPAAEINTPQEAELEALRAVSALTNTELKDALTKLSLLQHELEEAKLKIVELSEIAAFRRHQMEEKDIQIHELLELIKSK